MYRRNSAIDSGVSSTASANYVILPFIFTEKEISELVRAKIGTFYHFH